MSKGLYIVQLRYFWNINIELNTYLFQKYYLNY